MRSELSRGQRQLAWIMAGLSAGRMGLLVAALVMANAYP
jgi:hypothetical protein